MNRYEGYMLSMQNITQKLPGVFSVGDRVYISPTSQYASTTDKTNPPDTLGEIILTDRPRTYMILVHWDNGTENVYRPEDLIHESI